jgi:hypothetical protein
MANTRASLRRQKKQRMFTLDRTKNMDGSSVLCETFKIADAKGNIYQTKIGRSLSCTDVDAVSNSEI